MKKNLFHFTKELILRHRWLWLLGIVMPPLFTLTSRLLIAWINQEVVVRVQAVDTGMLSIILLAGTILAGVVFAEIMVYLFNCVLSLFDVRTDRGITQRMFTKILRADASSVKEHDTGEYITRYNRDIKATVDFSTMDIANFVYPLFIGIGYCIALILTNALVGAVITVMMALVMLLNVLFAKAFRRIERHNLDCLAAYTQVADSAMAGKMTMRMLGMQDRLVDMLVSASNDIAQNTQCHIRLSLVRAFSSSLLVSTCTTLILPFSCLLAVLHIMALPNAIYIGNLCGSLMGFTSSLAVAIIGMGDHLLSVRRTMEIVQLDDEDRDVPEGCKEPTPVRTGSALQWQDVNISYGQTNVLREIDLSVEPGCIIALVGPSGCGKSSMIQAALRLIPYQGHIQVWDQNIQSIPAAAYRKRVAYVSGSNDIIAGTLKENVAYGDMQADDAQIAHAMEAAALYEFLQGIEILDCDVGEKGGKISGGQQQRIALARAFLRDADLYFLDEATSALDTLSEQCVLMHLKWLAAQGKTIVLVSHRKSTIEIADRIYIVCKEELIPSRMEDVLEFFKQMDVEEKAAAV